MKKRVVAIMLSLTMCLSMAAEASAASEADFTAETAAADVSEVAVFDDTADEGSSDDASHRYVSCFHITENRTGQISCSLVWWNQRRKWRCGNLDYQGK